MKVEDNTVKAKEARHKEEWYSFDSHYMWACEVIYNQYENNIHMRQTRMVH